MYYFIKSIEHNLHDFRIEINFISHNIHFNRPILVSIVQFDRF